MITYKVSQILIGQKMIEEIVDSDGVKWYPMMKFIEQVLCRYERISTFLGTKVEDYMKIIQYPANRKFQDRLLNTWCINETGVIFLLKRMEIVKNPKKDNGAYLFRERGFYEACAYFGVKRPKTKLDPYITCYPPKNKTNDLWTNLCLKYDKTITKRTVWRRCPECGNFLPNNASYYGKMNKSGSCLRCQKKYYTCKNRTIQYLFKLGGINLIYGIYGERDERVSKIIRKAIERKDIEENEDKHS